MGALKVVHFGKFYPPHRGGMETVLHFLCRGLVKNEVDCEVIVAGDSEDARLTEDEGVIVRRMWSLGTVKSVSVCPEALWVLRSIRADVINIHHPNPLADMSYLLSRPSGRLVVTYHSDILGRPWLRALHRPLLYAVLKRADAIIATSLDYATSSPVLKEFRNKVHVIPLGIDPPANPINSSDKHAKGEPHFFFLGRLVPYKGLPVLLDALREVPGRLWIGGTGPLEEGLRKRAAKARLDGKIEFLGEITEEEKFRRFATCDAFVLPSVSRAEAFGLVLLEAMSMGRPVVVSDLPTGVRVLV
jgi:rhamnosyl/mannosyltransferase